MGGDDHKRGLYTLRTVGHRKQDLSRTHFELKCCVPFEQLNEDIVGREKDTKFKLEEAIAAGDLPRSYNDHPVVLANP